MPREIRVHQLEDLCNENEEILLQTDLNTELHIRRSGNETIISFPIGNKFNVIDGDILIKAITR